jgi:iron(III) transport system permease protein
VICLLLALIIFLVYGILIVSAMVQALPFNMTPTWKHFEYIGANSAPLINTFKFGAIAATICALFALVLAFLVQRKQWFGRGVIDFIAIMPAAVPGIFWGIGYATAFNQKWFEAIAYPIFGRDGTPGALIVIALLFWNIPIGHQAVIAGLQQIDRSLDEAATSLGASTLRGFRDILAPMLGSAVLTGFVTAFVRAVTTLSVVIFLFTPGTTTATITIFQKVNDADWGGAAAYTILVIGMAVLVVVGVWIVSGRRAGLRKT